MKKALAAAMSAVLGLSSAAAAQCPPEWAPGGFAGPGFDGYLLTSAVWDPDGPGPQSERLMVSGEFTMVDGVPIPGLAEWDGSQWRSVPLPPGAVRVRSLLAEDGTLIAGLEPAGVAAWDGSAWSSLGAGAGGAVHALARFNGQLYACGAFSSIGGAPGPIARLAASGWQSVPGWNASAEAPHSMAVLDQKLYIVSSLGFAWWDGSSLIHGPAPGDGILTLHVHDGELFIGCLIYNTNTHVQRWTGSTWVTHGSNLRPPYQVGAVSSLASYQGELYAAGDFVLHGTSSRGMARFRGGNWQGVAGAEYAGRFAQFDGRLLALWGQFPAAATNIAAWDGTTWQAWPPRPRLKGEVRRLERFDGELWACGDFVMDDMTGHFGWGAARLAGGQWVAEDALPEHYRAISLAQIGGAVYAGGIAKTFSVPGVYRREFGGWTPLSGLNVSGEHRGVTTLLEWKGSPMALGEFTVGTSHSAARWDEQAWAWTPLAAPPGVPLGGAVLDSELYICGKLATGTSGFVARYTGAAWVQVGPLFDAEVSALAFYEEGGAPQLIAAGSFQSVGAATAKGVARWHAGAWHAIGGGLQNVIAPQYPPEVRSARQHGRDLVVAGRKHSGVQWQAALFVWNGSRWSDIAGAGIEGHFNHVSPGPLGQNSWVGGGFVQIDGQPSPGLARLVNAPCYPNCDCSAQPPLLNIADFSCFLQRFAAGDDYANCDGSTVPPVLNIADFSCFLRKFAAGCE